MKQIKLLDLSCKNFMGFIDFKHSFDGMSTDVRGDNGTGKTTLKSLFNWILFGKNAEGENDTKFAVRPIKADGSMLRQVDIEGEMVLKVDNQEVKFKRVQTENWTKKRGTVEQEFTGNTTEYYIDDIPKKKSEYDKVVNEICDTEIFKLITDVEYFGGLHWKKQRDIVNNLLGVNEEEIINSDEKYAPLRTGKKVDEIMIQIKSEQTRINKDLEIIPTRIDERNKDINGIDREENIAYMSKLNDDLSTITEKLEKLNVAKFKGENQELISQEEAKLLSINNEMYEIKRKDQAEKNNYDISFNKRKSDIEREKNSLTYQIDDITNKIARFKKEIELDEENIKLLDDERTCLLNEYKEINNRTYIQGTCPLGKICNYDDIKENSLAVFNKKKAEDLENNKAKGLAVKEKKTKLLNAIEENKQKISNAYDEIDVIGKSIKDKEKELKMMAYDYYQSKYEEEIEAKQKEIEDLKNRIEYLKSKTDNEELDKKIEEVKQNKEKIIDELYNRKRVDESYQMIEKYTEEIKNLQIRYEKLEQIKRLCESFYVQRNAIIEKRNKEIFKIVRFKMFEEQINGGILETCIPTVRGVPYSDLNHAMKINAGLDIINVLQKIYGIAAPIWIDNAEAITKFIETNSQLIKLYVAEGYKQLEFIE